jgi:hypothetical protein
MATDGVDEVTAWLDRRGRGGGRVRKSSTFNAAKSKKLIQTVGSQMRGPKDKKILTQSESSQLDS